MFIRLLAIAAVVWTAAIIPTNLANGHSWYPPECCHDIDCAPVESATWIVTGAGDQLLQVTSIHGIAIVPNWVLVRESKDNRMHVCMSYDEFGNRTVLCFFSPPSV